MEYEDENSKLNGLVNEFSLIRGTKVSFSFSAVNPLVFVVLVFVFLTEHPRFEDVSYVDVMWLCSNRVSVRFE